MTQVNLQNELIGEWTFDDVDTDSHQNKLRDRSGYTRHLDLKAGVTTGISSPYGEAHHSGSGQELEYDKNERILTLDGGFSFFGIGRHSPDSSSTNTLLVMDGVYLQRRNNDWCFSVEGEGSEFVWSDDSNESLPKWGADDWKMAIGWFDPETNKAFIETPYSDTIGVSRDEITALRTTNIRVGANVTAGGSSSDFVGDIAHCMAWNRQLTLTERKYLYAISGRRVSQL